MHLRIEEKFMSNKNNIIEFTYEKDDKVTLMIGDKKVKNSINFKEPNQEDVNSFFLEICNFLLGDVILDEVSIENKIDKDKQEMNSIDKLIWEKFIELISNDIVEIKDEIKTKKKEYNSV